MNPQPTVQAPRLPPARPAPGAESSPISTYPGWAGWAALEPYSLDWECHLAELRANDLAAQQIACTGAWRAPTLTLTNLQATFTHGQLGLRAALNVATRALEAAVTSDVDPRRLASVLPKSAAQWVAQAAWTQPPRLSADIDLVLPAWTNREPDWHAEIPPAIRLEGQLQAPEGGAWKGVSVSGLQSHFSYSNQCWRLSGLRLTRPEGQLLASYSDDALTQEFYLRVAGSVDPRAARPWLGRGERNALDFFTFTQPPVIEAEVRGRRGDAKQLGIRGRVALTNFTFRGESASSLRNRRRSTRTRSCNSRPPACCAAPSNSTPTASWPISTSRKSLSPTVSARPTRWSSPAPSARQPPAPSSVPVCRAPAVRAHGIIPMHGEEEADLYFQVEAERFHWLNFTVPQVAANLHWAGLHLLLSGVRMDFYGGKADASAAFYFDPLHPGTDYQFTLSTSNTLLQALMADLSTRTNHLAGRLSGTLLITRANSEDRRQTQGQGALELRDGLILEIPLFGVFSPVLDSLAPGLGSSRASAGAARFVITNGVIHSDNLEIHSPPMRLRYWGNADLKGRLEARAEALLLRDVPFFGPLVSLAFSPVTKLFEFKVTGSINQPKTQPLYLLPRIMLVPLHPLRTLKGLLPEDLAPARTNAVPSIKR